jgi:hypothetical protein
MNALERRKRALVARIARQRLDLAMDAHILKAPLAKVDKGIALGRYLCAHPLIPALAAFAFAVWKPARTFRWMKRGWFLWGVYKNAREKLLA